MKRRFGTVLRSKSIPNRKGLDFYTSNRILGMMLSKRLIEVVGDGTYVTDNVDARILTSDGYSAVIR